jgi:hypothetical protein
MSMQLQSPHRFRERLLLFGGGGAGKSTAALSIARHCLDAVDGTMWVIDNDISASYERQLATEFTDVDRDRVDIYEADGDWEDYCTALERVIAEGDPETDWLVFDSFTGTWDAVQAWMSEQVHGANIADHMVRLRAESADVKTFNKELTEAMSWPLINRTYEQRMYKRLRAWKGHMILTAEGAATGKEDEAEVKELFGRLGVKPAGQKRLHHVASTNILLARTGDGWIMSAAKDRGREDVYRTPIEEGFALDYLRDVAGWERAK